MGVSRPPYRQSNRSVPRLRGNSDRRRAVFYECGTDRDPRNNHDLLYVDIINGNADLVDFVGFRFYPSRETHNVYKRKAVRLSDGTWAKRFLLKETGVTRWSRKVTVLVSGKGGSSRSWRLKARPGVVARERALKLYEPGELRWSYRTAPPRDFGVEIETSLDGSTTPSDVVRDVFRETGIHVVDRTESRGGGTADYSRWQLVPDGSLVCGRSDPHCNKFELVSRVLNGEPGLRECRRVLEALGRVGKADNNKSMGFHVHVSVEGLSLEALKNICLNFVKHEAAMDSFMPPSRTGSGYCRSNRTAVPGNTGGEKHAAIASCKTLAGLCELLNPGRVRYHKLNLQNLLKPNPSKPTIEFRQHSSTTNCDKIEAWVRFCTSLVARSSRERPAKLKHHEEAFDSLFDTAVEDLRLKDFYRKRRAALLPEHRKRVVDHGCAGDHNNHNMNNNNNHDDIIHNNSGNGPSGPPCAGCLKGGACERH